MPLKSSLPCRQAGRDSAQADIRILDLDFFGERLLPEGHMARVKRVPVTSFIRRWSLRNSIETHYFFLLRRNNNLMP